ncbi:MAG TPA: SNF2-related protein, partial [Allocoleopsis sp.]
MPRIFDNIEQHLLPFLQDTLKTAYRADFCVGYFNLRGWQKIDQQIEHFTGGNHNCCRLLIGMQKHPQDILYESLSFLHTEKRVDQGDIIRGKKAIAQEFYKQLILGAPTNEDQAGLRRLKHQILSQKLTVKLFLQYPLHAKLYLIHRQDLNNPITGFLGSSNLTLSGLKHQGELNIDVLDHDSCNKLQKWFDERWNDRYCVDISQEIVNIIDQSWASEILIPPYHIYLKMAYHLSSEARAGLLEYQIPQSIKDQLFDFQAAAVKIAARHVHQRGGVLLGDVVGLGKTRIAATLAKVLEEDFFLETLIICPKNLVSMWQDYVHDYKLRAEVLSISKVQQELPKYRRFRVVLIDESHNLRNREGKRYQVIKDYINLNESRCILLTATPYNKTYLDLSSQLRLFIPEEKNLGIRPENLIRELGGEKEFNHKYQIPTRCLGAFEKSEYSDDWRDLMRLYMIRRPRSFIQKNYAQKDEYGKQYLLFADGSKSYFPIRVPKTLTFNVHDYDIYGILYS